MSITSILPMNVLRWELCTWSRVSMLVGDEMEISQLSPGLPVLKDISWLRKKLENGIQKLWYYKNVYSFTCFVHQQGFVFVWSEIRLHNHFWNKNNSASYWLKDLTPGMLLVDKLTRHPNETQYAMIMRIRSKKIL